MITNVSLKHTTENLKEGHKAVLMKQGVMYTSSSAVSLASFPIEDHILFLYNDHPGKSSVKIIDAISMYKEYPKGTVLTITQNCF